MEKDGNGRVDRELALSFQSPPQAQLIEEELSYGQMQCQAGF